jgi:hypothetical protein
MKERLSAALAVLLIFACDRRPSEELCQLYDDHFRLSVRWVDVELMHCRFAGCGSVLRLPWIAAAMLGSIEMYVLKGHDAMFGIVRLD